MFKCNKCGHDREKSSCKNCNRLKTQKFREKNRDKINEKRREERKNNKKDKVIGANNSKKEEIKDEDNSKKLLTPAMIKKIETENDEKKNKERERSKIYYEKNKEAILARGREYKKKNAEALAIKSKEYLQETKDYVKQRYRKYCVNNREKIAEISRNYRNNNISVKLRNTFRSRILENINKNNLTTDYLDTTIERVMIWLKYNFKDDMAWDNYGSLWNIDHTLPLNIFDLTKKEHIFICFNWRNLIPMYVKDNIAKHNKIKPYSIFYQEYKLQNFITEVDDDEEILKTNEYIKNYTNFIKEKNLFKVVPNALNKM
jgi:hypothetical protein